MENDLKEQSLVERLKAKQANTGMPVLLLSVPVTTGSLRPGEPNHYTEYLIAPEEFKEMVSSLPVQNHIHFKDTVDLINEWCGVELTPNQNPASQEPEQIALIFQVGRRLPPGAVLSRADLEGYGVITKALIRGVV